MRKLTMLAAAGAVAGLAAAGLVAAPRVMRAQTPAPAFYFPLAEPQKAAYHVSTGGGWFGREHRHLLDVLENHVEATGPGFIDLRAVLQGDGVDILVAARDDEALSRRIDALRAGGVRFVPCANTLISRRIDPSLLYGVKPEDLVSAGVAELARLQSQGFAYIRF
jgi:intracellular sulfur oxidation DsrE/DsrF family protein